MSWFHDIKRETTDIKRGKSKMGDSQKSFQQKEHLRTFHKIKHEVQQDKMLNINLGALTHRLNETTGYL